MSKNPSPYLQMVQTPLGAVKAVGTGLGEVGSDLVTFQSDLHDFITQEWSRHQILLTAASWMLVYYLIFVGLWAENIVPGMQQKCWVVNNNCSTLVGNDRVCVPENGDDVNAITVTASGSSAPYYPLFFHLPILLYFAGAFVFCIYHSIVRDIPKQNSALGPSGVRVIVTDIAKYHTIVLWLVAFILFVIKQMGMGGLDVMPWWAITLLPAFSHFVTAIVESVLIVTSYDKLVVPSLVPPKTVPASGQQASWNATRFSNT